jgi:hypothetical protein
MNMFTATAEVNNWRVVWEASKVEKQQAQKVQELTGKLRPPMGNDLL